MRNGAPRYDTIHVGAGSASAPLCSRLAPSVDVVVVGCAAAAPGLASSPPPASWSPADGPAWFLAACGGAFLRWRLLLAGPFDPLAASRSRSPLPPPRAFPADGPFWRSRCSASSLRAFSNAAPSAVFCAAPPCPAPPRHTPCLVRRPHSLRAREQAAQLRPLRKRVGKDPDLDEPASPTDGGTRLCLPSLPRAGATTAAARPLPCHRHHRRHRRRWWRALWLSCSGPGCGGSSGGSGWRLQAQLPSLVPPARHEIT
eukprot:COSAG01_NODE_4711_length_4798_cov_5.933177_3_plen_257_part_00